MKHINGKLRLLAVVGAFQTSGGMACVARSTIRTVLDKQKEDDHLIVYSFMESGSIEFEKLGFKYKGEFTYKTFNNNKIKFVLNILSAVFIRRPDFIFFDYINLASFMGILGQIKIVKYHVWVHGLEAYPPNPNVEGMLGIKGAAHVYCHTEYTKKLVEHNIKGVTLDVCSPALEPEMSFIPNKICKTEDIYLRNILGTVQVLENKVILTVGRMDALQRHKGQDTLIKSFPEIRSKIPEAQLVLVGCGTDKTRLIEIALSLSKECQEAIFFSGFVPELVKQKLYASCYCFVMASRGEGFGLVYLEAMRWGKLCLASAKDAACCVVMDEETGILFQDSTSTEEMAVKIIDILQNFGKAAYLGKKGQELVKSQYFYEHFRDRFWSRIS